MQGIVQEGEYSLFYFNGDYSHTILKTPKPGDFRVQEEHGGLIVGVQPSDDLLAAGAQVISNSPENLLYARVDLVTDGHGGYYLVELELIEPALFLGTDHAAPERFANAINRYLELG